MIVSWIKPLKSKTVNYGFIIGVFVTAIYTAIKGISSTIVIIGVIGGILGMIIGGLISKYKLGW